MPVFKSGKGLAPEWCEMEYFDIVNLNPGQTHRFERMGKKEILIIGDGKCRVAFEGQTSEAEKGNHFTLKETDSAFEISNATEPAIAIRMAGRWGDQIGGVGLFPVWNIDKVDPNWGDPVNYAKTTPFDNHFHDCDEYWILYQGSGTAVSEGKAYEVGSGDCVVTGMGHHHDFPLVKEPVIAVCFEGTMEARKRPGHLWEHKDGPAEPIAERV